MKQYGQRAPRVDSHRRQQIERVLRRMRQRIFDLDDQGRGEQGSKIIALCKQRLMPDWESEARSRANQKMMNYMM